MGMHLIPQKPGHQFLQTDFGRKMLPSIALHPRKPHRSHLAKKGQTLTDRALAHPEALHDAFEMHRLLLAEQVTIDGPHRFADADEVPHAGKQEYHLGFPWHQVAVRDRRNWILHLS
jgi:hypothetical protein